MPGAFGGAASPVHTPAQDASADDVRLSIDRRISKSQRTSFSWIHDLTSQGKIKKGQRYILEGYDRYLEAKKYMYPEEHKQLKEALSNIVKARKKVRANKGILPKTIQVRIFGKDDFLTPDEFINLAVKFRERARTVSDIILLESDDRSRSMVNPTVQESVGDLLQTRSDSVDLDPTSITSRAGFDLVGAMADADSEMNGDGQRFDTLGEVVTFLANEAGLDCVGLYIPDDSTGTSSGESSTGSNTESEHPSRSVRTMPGGFSELESFATVVFEMRGPAPSNSAS